ncbi:Protein TIFY 5A [Apostasia shenzhenica]|uniref:Protein TIFY 5A n=1 Tax=Apostasia shenzhenica TaxID=1088818 RepID=A0A2H9ZR56_9ASPA|nr:Protein TIFY 5A [Apostasia shenzhenica]
MERHTSTAVVEPEELALRLGTRSPTSPASTSAFSGSCPPEDDHRRQVTIFYNGRICVASITDLQAKAIIQTVKEEVEGTKREENRKPQQKKMEESPAEAPVTARAEMVNPRISMKRSLQRFLQKRKERTTNYSCHYIRKRSS